MGLFDNLFLDQNTPVMINDGVDHSKDVVTEIIPPSSQGGSSSGKGDDGSTSTNPQNSEIKKEGGFDELFEEGKKKEIVDTPAPAVEFKLSSETLGVPASSNSTSSGKSEDSGISFDIGGDMSFDIGADMGQSSQVATPTSTTGSFIQSSSPIDPLGVSISENNSMIPQSTEASNVSVDVVSNVEASPEITPSFTDAQDVENNKETDSALFSLLNDDVPVVESVIPNVSVAEAAPISISEDTSFISPLENSSSIAESAITSETTLVSESKKEEDPSIFGTTIVPVMTTDASPIEINAADIHSDTTSPAASKLKSKLEEFIDELKTLELEDQEVKAKKRQQFEMFRVRAQEIKAEYDMRIRALELEEKALENQIAAMDNEKTQIKDVIRAFKIELEKA